MSVREMVDFVIGLATYATSTMDRRGERTRSSKVIQDFNREVDEGCTIWNIALKDALLKYQ